jgi:hypothetical protein
MLSMVFGLMVVAVSAPAEAHYTGSSHYHNYPGSWTYTWYNECGKFSPYDSGTYGEPADCEYKPQQCLFDSVSGTYKRAQYVSAHQLDGDTFNFRGPVFSNTVCSP